MLGIEGVNRAVGARLAERMPAKLAELRTRYQVDLAELPDVAQIEPVPVAIASIERFPFIMLAPQDTDGTMATRQLETDGAWDEYQLHYRVRVYLFGMATSPRSTGLLVQRLALAARETLLQDRQVYNRGGETVEVDPAGLRESYSETEPADAAYLGGAYLELRATTVETLAAQLPPVDGAPVIETGLEATTQAVPFDQARMTR